MARDVRLEAVRDGIVKSLYGRRLGLDHNDVLLGPKAYRVPIEGWTSGASTIPSTSVTLTKYGVSIIGTTGSSGTSAASTATQQLPAPEPGIEKFVVNVSTASLAISTVTGSAYFRTSASSTYQYATFGANGAYLKVVGISTALWQVTSIGVSATVLTSAASTSSQVVNNVTFA